MRFQSIWYWGKNWGPTHSQQDNRKKKNNITKNPINQAIYKIKEISFQLTLTTQLIKPNYPIYNGNWTEWSAIWAEITSTISDQNCTRQSSIPLYYIHFEIAQIQDFKYFVTTILSQFQIKLIHFLGGKNKSFGNKSCKICHMTLHVFHLPAIWSVTLNKPWSLIGCFVFSVASS